MDKKAKAKHANVYAPAEEVLRARVVWEQLSGRKRLVPVGKNRPGSWMR